MIASERVCSLLGTARAMPCKSVVAAVARDTNVCERAVAQHHMGCIHLHKLLYGGVDVRVFISLCMCATKYVCMHEP